MEISALIEEIENKLKTQFLEIERIALFNQKKILQAFQEERIAPRHFAQTNGYGYSDEGREKLALLFARIFKAESALVSPYFSCGSHAIYSVLSALLRPNDKLLSITGAPYDTLIECIIGKENEDIGSLKDFNVNYEKIELTDGIVDINAVIKSIQSENPKVIFIQRSRGYSARNPLSSTYIGEIIKKLKKHSNAYFVVDNCYGEFVETIEPSEFGADICVGSLIKNPGGGLAPTGAYVVGSKKAVDFVGKRLFSPSLDVETGSYSGGYRLFFQGLFMAPHIVSQSIKGMMMLGEVCKSFGCKIFPESTERHLDIIKSICFDKKEDLINFCQIIQKNSPIDSYVSCEPWAMPGYTDEVIMAAGTFVQGASIELSCDAPIREPYIVYIQGGLTYEHTKIVAEEVGKYFENIANKI